MSVVEERVVYSKPLCKEATPLPIPGSNEFRVGCNLSCLPRGREFFCVEPRFTREGCLRAVLSDVNLGKTAVELYVSKVYVEKIKREFRYPPQD